MPDRLTEVLEACYLALGEGREPDLGSLCGSDRALRDSVTRILARERHLVRTARPSANPMPEAGGEGTPRTIGEFRILELIGSGGMGRVFRAHQASLDRQVAVKVLREEVLDTDAARLRLQREATVTAALDHPNIVPIYATGEDRGRVYLAMKLLRGQPLDRQPLPLDPERVARIGVAVASALHAAHQVGVVHRDIKPANVLLEHNTPYVVDFGLARLQSPTTALTQGHAAPGTLAYMAPELLQERAPVFDPRADVYGLGATLYETLRGCPPFADELPVRLLRQVLFSDPSPLQLTGRHRDLETIVLRALEKVPARRFGSAAEMGAELKRYLAGDPILSRPLGAWGRVWRRARRRPGIAALIAVAALLFVALGVIATKREIERRDRDARDIAAVERALATDGLEEGRVRLRALRERGDRPEFASLAAQLDTEADLRSLTVLVQSSIVHANPNTVTPLVDRLRSCRLPRACLAVAVFESLVGDSTRIDLDAELRSRFPRTAAAADALAVRGDPVVALARMRASSATDHVFAALILRLVDAPATDAEAELRDVSMKGPETAAVQFSRAIAFERMGEFRTAYLELNALEDQPLYAAVAHTTRARLAAMVGHDDAAVHLARARSLIVADGPEFLRVFLITAELQLARDHVDSGLFWKVWNDGKPLLERAPFYWQIAGDVARTDGDLDKARRALQTGLDLGPDRRRRLTLLSDLLQVDWLLSPWWDEPEPPDDDLPQERTRLAALAVRARDLVADARAEGRSLIAAEALLTEARCARVLGDRRTGWQLLDRACREYATPEALSAYAFLVTHRILVRHMSSAEDPDAATGTPLAAAAITALERARAIEARARLREPAATDVLYLARYAILACAFHVGDADSALPLALEMVGDESTPEELRPLCERVIEWGGLPLDRILEGDGLPPHDFVAAQLRSAIATLQATETLTNDQRRATAQRWSDACEGLRRSTGEPWKSALADLGALLAALDRR